MNLEKKGTLKLTVADKWLEPELMMIMIMISITVFWYIEFCKIKGKKEEANPRKDGVPAV